MYSIDGEKFGNKTNDADKMENARVHEPENGQMSYRETIDVEKQFEFPYYCNKTVM